MPVDARTAICIGHSVNPGPTPTLLRAEVAMAAVDKDPAVGLSVARQALADAQRAGDLAAASVAERAWGHALLHTGTVADATRHLRRSIVHGESAGSARLVAEARLKLAYAVLQRGRPHAALQEIDLALEALDGAPADRFHGTRGIVLYDIGRLDEALAELDTALALMRPVGDLVAVQRALINRALVYSGLHVFAAAERDLREAEELARRLDRGLTVGLIANNLGQLESLRGDVPAALEHLDRAEEVIAEHGAQLGTLHQDRAELLLSVGLVSEAGAAAARAVDAYASEGRALKVPEVRLLVAQAAFLDGDLDRALAEARRAGRAFRRQGREERAALARLVELRIRLALGGRVRVGAEELVALVRVLAGAGWPGAATEARIVASRLVGGETGHDLLSDAAGITRGRGPAVLRARGWYARALLKRGAGDRRGVMRAARSGLRLLDDHSASMAATDLRVHAATHRRDLVELGLREALDGGRPAAVFEWVERGRASRLRSVTPPEDPELAAMLAQLRALARDDASPAGAQAALERRIRDHVRRGRALPGGEVTGPVRVSDLAGALEEAALVEFIALDGQLIALTVVDGRSRLHALGPVAAVTALADRLPFALHRLARGGRTTAGDAGLAGAAVLLDAAALRLDALLLGPLHETADRALVVVPTGALHSLPWSVLPSCRGRPVSVSPSATLWYDARARTRLGRDVVVVAGPALEGALAEARAVGAIHDATVLAGAAATADAVLAALAVSDLAHLAAHGRLVADNPLFSDLLLADGPLMVYDLERLPRVPHTVVLAACESGRSQVFTGDELLGLTSTFLARGAARLVASVLPVPDAQTTPLMVAFHRRVAAGASTARALADAQVAAGDDVRSLAAAAGFVCFGHGS